MEADEQIQKVSDSPPLPVVVLIHHPDEWWHDEESHAYPGRPNTRDYLAERCHLIMNGHTHGEVRKADRIAQSAIHLTGGAAFAGASHFNSFRIIRIKPDSLTYRSFEYDPRRVGDPGHQCFRMRRCLIAVDGYCEWNAAGRKKQPCFIPVQHRRALAPA